MIRHDRRLQAALPARCLARANVTVQFLRESIRKFNVFGMRSTLRVAVCTVMLAATLVPLQPASAGRQAGVETIAALAPHLTAGRGATVSFVEQEAENA
jgi:hypothetical protein